MWMAVVLTLGFVFSGSAFAEEIYRSVDAQGRVHYTNGPSRDADNAESGAPAEASAPADAGTLAEPADESFSTSASLRRNAFERDLRATDKQLRVVDERLAMLSRARMQNANGSLTGGIVGNAGDARSEEEKALAAQRQQLAQHAIEVRDAVTKLREEVTARLGATPEWWVDVR